MGSHRVVEDSKQPSRKVKSDMYLSKSLYIRGLQCHKALYLEKFHPEWKDQTSADTQARFYMGNMVGEAAHNLFPGGVLVPYIENGMEEQLPSPDRRGYEKWRKNHL